MDERTRIKEFIKNTLVNEDDDINILDSDNIFKMGFVNSLFAMKLVLFIEQEFDMKIDNDDMEIKNFQSVENIMKFIEKKNACAQ